MNHALKWTQLMWTALLALGLSACHTTPYRVKQDFGTSAQGLVAAQAVAPGEETAAIDGPKGEGILEYYRDTNRTGDSQQTMLPIGALISPQSN